MLLEKAYCKHFGNYGVTEFEVVDYAMEDILGVPAFGFMLKNFNQQEICDKIADFDKKK